ncbi:MAG: hypothetical protein M3Z27_07415 [Actinomycetota bacterium]|nr:hypothetical protein [Actinomycetota bacterium]
MKKLTVIFGVLAVLPASAWAAPRVPTEISLRDGSLQIRPYVIDWTGDGSGFLGGFTRRHSFHKYSRGGIANFGRLHWTTYNGKEGRAWGAVWIDDFIPDGASGTFRASKVTVHVYRPRDGVFTRLEFRYGHHRVTLSAVHSGAYWHW